MTAEYSDDPVTEEFLPELNIHAPERQRRWTVLLRWLLLIPHYIVLYFLGIAAFVVVFLGWWGALFLGRLPDWATQFLTGYLRYVTRVNVYSYLLTDTYPSFGWNNGDDDPVSIRLQPGRLNRWAVFFRFILLIPAGILASILAVGWAVLAFFLWLTVLILGRTPQPVFGATAAIARFSYRYQAYAMMLTSAYPKRLFGDEAQIVDEPGWPEGDARPESTMESGSAVTEPARVSDTRPLILTKGGSALLVVFIVLGVLGYVGGGVAGGTLGDNSRNTTRQVPGDIFGY